MAVISGTQICIPAATGTAGRIISAMEELLSSRHRHAITRRMFMLRWAKMRKALFLTEEYRTFRKSVLSRCGGICESCRKHPAEHVHHIRPVAFSPRLALITVNGKGTCVGCHTALDKTARTQALQHRNPTESSSGAPTVAHHRSSLTSTSAPCAQREAHTR